MSSFGERVAEDVRCYLNTNGLTQSKLTGAVLAELIDRRLKHETINRAKKKRLATEDDWLREVEALPHLKGIDVRKELAKCQFWCKTNGKDCTKRRFTNWLGRADLEKIINPGGAEQPKRVNGVEHAPTGWLTILNELYPDSVLARGGLFEIKAETEPEWAKLDKSLRSAISTEAGKR